MKSLSRITALIISFVFVITLAAAQILYCLHSTITSPRHISRLLEDDYKLTELATVLYSSLAASNNNSNESFVNKYVAKVLINTDQTWVKSQIYIASKGIHQYVFADASTLPTLDIIPLKKSLKDVIVKDIMNNEESKQKTEKIKTILSVLNNKYFAKVITFGLNSQLISMLLELAPIRSTGFDRATIQEIVRIYLSLNNESISLEQASISISEQMTVDLLRLNNIKDYFDINLFLEASFGEQNPLRTIKVFVASIDKTASYTISIMFWSLLLLLFIQKRFQLVKVLRAVACCLLASSILMLLISVPLISKTLVESLVFRLHSEPGSLSLLTCKYIGFFAKDLGSYLILQAFLTIVASALSLLIISKLKTTDKKVKLLHRLPVIRLSLVIIALSLIIIIFSSISLSNDIKAFKTDMAELSNIDMTQAMINGLVEAGGMEFLNIITKASN